MKYYTFQEQFHKPIIDRIKTSTIRQKAKVKPGETFSLRYWTGTPYRSKMGVLGTAECVAVRSIGIDTKKCEILLSNVPLEKMFFENFAKSEGFGSAEIMFAWFGKYYGPYCNGYYTQWAKFTKETP